MHSSFPLYTHSSGCKAIVSLARGKTGYSEQIVLCGGLQLLRSLLGIPSRDEWATEVICKAVWVLAHNCPEAVRRMKASDWPDALSDARRRYPHMSVDGLSGVRHYVAMALKELAAK